MRTRPLFAGAVVALAVALPLVSGACKKPAKAGDPCENEWATNCTSATKALICVSGKLEAMTCGGASGCVVKGKGNDECANDTQNVDEPCKEDGTYDCGAGSKTLLKCDGKHWTKVDDCKGPKGCAANSQGATCDQGEGEGSCTQKDEGNGRCSRDGKALLMCRSGKMVVAATCKGANGCRQRGTDIDCNQTIADVGDPCHEGTYACATNQQERLLCRNGKMVGEKACKSCTVVAEKVQCEPQ